MRRDKNKGVYGKFEVRRTDGRDAPGRRHHGCQYFVLDLDHDAFAVDALHAYAEACAGEFPKLSEDLFRIVDELNETGLQSHHLLARPREKA